MARQHVSKTPLRKQVQVFLTFDPITKELLIRGRPRDEDMIRFVVDAAQKHLRQREVRHFLTQPMEGASR